MDQAVVHVDVEEALRAWARDNVTVVDRRVFFGVNNNVAKPQIVLRRLGGPDEACLVQFDCWGTTKAESAATAMELADELTALARFVHDEMVLKGADTPDIRWLPDPESDLPRHIVTVTVTASSSLTGS